MPKHLFAHISVFLANVIYGINYTVAKKVMPEYIRPFGFIVIRAGGALILIFLVWLVLFREKIDKKDIGLLFLGGLFGVAINQCLFFWGLNLTSPINSSIIMVTNPILVLLIAWIWLKDPVSPLRFTGILIGLAGASTLLFLKPVNQKISGDLFGDVLTFINALSYAIYLVIIKPLMGKYNPVTVMMWVFAFGWVMVIPVGWTEFNEIQWQQFDGFIWGSVVFVVVGSTFFAYLLNMYGLQRLSPSVVSAYIYLQPVLSTTVAMMAGEDHPDWIKIISTLTIFAGVYMVSLPNEKRLWR
ncbi:MAG: DMT family transporter [Bacteroidota bacterium]